MKQASTRVEQAAADDSDQPAPGESGDYGGLPALLALCAKAEALAGGDEAQALRRLEKRVVRVSA